MKDGLHRYHFMIGDTSSKGEPIDTVFFEAEVTAGTPMEAVQLLRAQLHAEKFEHAYMPIRSHGRPSNKVGVTWFQTVLDTDRLTVGSIDRIDGERVWLEEMDEGTMVCIGGNEDEGDIWVTLEDWYAHHRGDA